MFNSTVIMTYAGNLADLTKRPNFNLFDLKKKKKIISVIFFEALFISLHDLIYHFLSTSRMVDLHNKVH